MLTWSGVRWAVFASATALLLLLSRRSLLSLRSHGFYRFFVFEAILGLILLNLAYWFRNPFAWNQVISWFLLLTSVLMVVLGARELHRSGAGGAARRDEPELMAFERTTRLVASGIFRYVRHPMYSSLLFLAWGVFFKLPSVPGAVLALISTAGVIVMAQIEEVENSRTFGPAYREYMLRTRRFIPHVV